MPATPLGPPGTRRRARPARPARHRWAGGLLALALGLPAAAWAAPKDDARRHFMAGLEATRAQDYQRALDEFLLAQELYPRPAGLYNIARAHADLGQLEEAIAYYRRFQAAAPDKAADVAPLIAVLEGRLRESAAEAPAPEGGGASATTAELARLQAIADELAALSARLAERGPAAEAAGAPPEDGAPASPAPPAGEGAAPGEERFADAYDEVVVSASRYGQDPLDSPSTVTIITDEDLRMSGATNIPDALRRVVGVDVMQLSAAQPDVSIRGFNRRLSNKVLVLIDGRSVYQDILSTPLWAILPISLQEIERIEVIRGPGSAVYGANAVTGVINIITRTPGEGENLLHVEAGDPGYTQGTALVTGREGPSAYRFSAGYHQTGRWSMDQIERENTSLVYKADNPDLSLQMVRASGRVDRQLGDDAFLSLSGGYSRGSTEFYVFGRLGAYALPYEYGLARADLTKGPVHLRAFYNKFVAEAGPWTEEVGERSLYTDVDSDTLDVELEGDRAFATGALDHRLVAGVGYRYKAIQWGYLEGGGSPIDEHHLRAFVQDQATAGRLAMVGSLRLDRHPLVPIGKTISPRAALIYRLADQTSVRLNSGTSFRAPSQMESYLDLDQQVEADALFVRTLGNRNLDPERIFTVEAGVHDESTDVHRVDLALYYNRVTDLIFVQDIVPSTNPYDPEANGFAIGSTTFGNLAPVYDGFGAELDTRFFPVDGLDLYANASVQRTYQTEGDTTTVEGSASAVKLNLGAMVRTPWRVDLATHVHYVSAQTWTVRDYNIAGKLVDEQAPIDARTVLVGRLGLRPLPDDSLELALTTWNPLATIQGEGKLEHAEGQRVGSRLFGSATWRF